MKHNPLEARTLFIDGPVAIYISTASREEILAAHDRLTACVLIAAEQLHNEHTGEIMEVTSDAARPQR